MPKSRPISVYLMVVVTLLVAVDAALDAVDNAKNQINFDRPIDLIEATPLKHLPIGIKSASSITLLNGRIYVMYENFTELGVFDSISFTQFSNIPLRFPDIKPSVSDIPKSNILQNKPTNGSLSIANNTKDEFSYGNHSNVNSSSYNNSSANFSNDNFNSNRISNNPSSANFSYDNRTAAYLARANLSDDKFTWTREIFSCSKSGNLFVSVKNSERGIRIWKMDFQGSSNSLWLKDPMLEPGLQDAIVTGTGCAVIIIRIYENDIFTLTLYTGNGTVELKIKIEESDLFVAQEGVFPIQAFETKWRTFLLIFGPPSQYVAIEINQKGDVLRTLPRDADKRNLADVDYAFLSTIDVHSSLFVVDVNAKSVAAIDEDLSHSRLLFKNNDTSTSIYSDNLSGQLFIGNTGKSGSSIDIYSVIYHEDDRKPNKVPGQDKL